MGKFRPLQADELTPIWPLVEKYGLVRNFERLRAYWQKWPGNFWVSSDGVENAVAVVGSWRSHLSMGAIYIFEVLPHLEEAFLTHLVELLASSGYEEVVSPPLEKGKGSVFQTFGFIPFQIIEVWGTELGDREESFTAEPPERIEIRKVNLDDLEDLKEVEKSAFDQFWQLDEEFLLNTLDNEIGFVAVASGRIAGYNVGSIRHGVGTVVRLAVGTQWQGQGIGLRLMATLLNWFRREGIRSIMVSTQKDNQVAKELYSKFGFRPLLGEIVIWKYGLGEKSAASRQS